MLDLFLESEIERVNKSAKKKHFINLCYFNFQVIETRYAFLSNLIIRFNKYEFLVFNTKVKTSIYEARVPITNSPFYFVT